MCVLRIHRFLSSPAILILNSTANSEVIYLFLHRNHHSGISHPISTDSSPLQISPTSIHQPLTPAHLSLPNLTLPPSIYLRSEEVTGTYRNTLFRLQSCHTPPFHVCSTSTAHRAKAHAYILSSQPASGLLSVVKKDREAYRSKQLNFSHSIPIQVFLEQPCCSTRTVLLIFRCIFSH